MKLTLLRKFLPFALIVLPNITPANLAQAFTFEEQAVEQSQFIAIARPYGENKYDLLVIEQIPGQQQCWKESGSNPVLVEPLLLNFDFTGSCQRNTDSNGYSIRVDGQDYGLDYLFRIVQRNGELVLLGTPRSDLTKPEILVGRTQGLGSGFLKIILEPGWKFAKRTYEGKMLGHVYFSGDRSVLTPPENSTVATAEPAATPSTDGNQTNNNSNGDDNSAIAAASETANTSNSNPNSTTTNPSEPVKEITFTAEDSSPSDTQAPLKPLFPPSSSSSTSTSNSSSYTPLQPLFPSSSSSTSTASSTSAASSSSNTLPPPPAIPSGSQSNQVQSVESTDSSSTNDSSSSSERANLSDLLVLAPATNNPDVVPVPQPPSVSNSSGNLSSSYRVMAATQNGSQQEQLRSLYPDAFPTVYNGQSMWQIGVFSSRDNAESALQSLKNAGVDGVIIQ